MKNYADADLFDDRLMEKLGYHVYALYDPETGVPFYIGKGGGKSGAGNARILGHFEEAGRNSTNPSAKVQKIKEIWSTDRDVPWKILRSGLQSEDAAFEVESALIETLRDLGIPLTNKQAGHGQLERGIKSPSDLRAWAAPVLDLKALHPALLGRPIFLFNIGKGVEEHRHSIGVADADIYDRATCQYWTVSKENLALENAIAIGCVGGVSRTAIEIQGWQKGPNRRWEIVPKRQSSRKEDMMALCNKRVSAFINAAKGYWQRGNYLIIQINDDRTFTVLRGASKGSRTMNAEY
jgi:hypothetical protein